MLSSFRTNIDKLSRLLEEKEIEIEELRFIRESTLINMQGSRKKRGDSAYSFTPEQ
jgi:hypothetical protein